MLDQIPLRRESSGVSARWSTTALAQAVNAQDSGWRMPASRGSRRSSPAAATWRDRNLLAARSPATRPRGHRRRARGARQRDRPRNCCSRARLPRASPSSRPVGHHRQRSALGRTAAGRGAARHHRGRRSARGAPLSHRFRPGFRSAISIMARAPARAAPPTPLCPRPTLGRTFPPCDRGAEPARPRRRARGGAAAGPRQPFNAPSFAERRLRQRMRVVIARSTSVPIASALLVSAAAPRRPRRPARASPA